MLDAILRAIDAIEKRLGQLEAQGGPGRWVDWTPILVQGGALNTTVTEAKYCVIGKVCHIYGHMTCAAAGTSGQVIYVTGIPAAATIAHNNSDSFPIGVGHVLDTGTKRYTALVYPGVGGDRVLMQWTADGAYVGAETATFALANNDVIGFTATYRVA